MVTRGELVEAIEFVARCYASGWTGPEAERFRAEPPIGYWDACDQKLVGHGDDGWLQVTPRGQRFLVVQ